MFDTLVRNNENDMLWKKESNGMYVDFLVSDNNQMQEFFEYLKDEMVPIPQKDDAMAFEKRQQGNKLFGQGEWHVAMELYNESLCYAVEGSEHISLALANRSACFFNMKLFTKCLIDIEWAKEAGYPEHLMPKLDQRKANCMKFIEEGVQIVDNFGKKLSFDPDEKFPCMADVLKIQREPNGDFCVIAKEDIDVGKTIVVEDTIHNYLYGRHGLKCNYCLKGDTNLIPCKKCTVAMFCSEKCQNALHKNECGMEFCDDAIINGTVAYTLRSILWAINLFSDFEELMSFVERVNASGSSNHPDTWNDDRSKYWTFLEATKFNSKNHNMYASLILKQFERIEPYNSILHVDKLRRFFIHLIVHHIRSIQRSAYTITLKVCTGEEENRYVSKIGLISKFFKHCCGPNVMIISIDDKLTFISVRPVKKGDELTISLCESFYKEKDVRQQKLSEQFGFVCKCALCEDTFPQSRTQQHSIIEQDFLDLQMCQTRLFTHNKEQVDEILTECIAYLKKFNDIRWSDEIGIVFNIYNQFLSYRFVTPFQRRKQLKIKD